MIARTAIAIDGPAIGRVFTIKGDVLSVAEADVSMASRATQGSDMVRFSQITYRVLEMAVSGRVYAVLASHHLIRPDDAISVLIDAEPADAARCRVR